MKLPFDLRLTIIDHAYGRVVLLSAAVMLLIGLAYADPTLAAQRRGKKGLPPTSTHQADRREDSRRRNATSEARHSAGQGKKGIPSTTIAKHKPAISSPREEGRRTRSQNSPTPPPRVMTRREEPVEMPPPAAAPPTTDYSSARIETIEYGSTKYNQITRQLSLPTTGRGSAGDTSKGRINVSTRRIEVDIAPERVIEIQRALIERKYLEGEPNGVYDDVTIEAMRQFQTKEQIDVTGYPTAHSLKRLGLTR